MCECPCKRADPVERLEALTRVARWRSFAWLPCWTETGWTWLRPIWVNTIPMFATVFPPLAWYEKREPGE